MPPAPQPSHIAFFFGQKRKPTTDNNFPVIYHTTGGVYTVARKWFNADKESIHWVIHLHNMAALSIGGVWPLIIAVMIGALICTGAPLSRMWKGIFPSKAILSRYRMWLYICYR